MRQGRRTPLDLQTLEDRSVPSTGGIQVDPNAYEADSILVRLKPGAPQVLAAIAPGVELDRPVGLVDGLWIVRLSAGTNVPGALAAAQASPYVAYAEPDYTLSLSATPNDPRYTDGTLWGMNKIAMPAAWDVRTDGSNTVVAVVDTGADYNHPDLYLNIWVNTSESAGAAGVDDDGNGFVDDIRGWDFANNDNNPMDDNSHGTHVSGTIGGIGNNGVGVVGVNWAASIMPLKFLGASGSGSTGNAILAINYAVANGARVSNHSYGGGGFSQAYLDALNAAGNAGHLVVAAAGNSGTNNDASPFYPASYLPSPDNLIAVAATDSADRIASFSNYGATSVDLAAPGVNIYSTVPGGYGYKSGTSMAAPHVAGAAALVWSADPSLSLAQLRSRILNTTDSIDDLNSKGTVTNGRLNVARAMPAGPALPSFTITDATVTEGNAGTVGAQFTVTLSAASAAAVTVDFATAAGSAGSADYNTASGTLTFNPGAALTQTITVDVLGDLEAESNETFVVNLSNASGATIQDGQGTGTIVDDDAVTPEITIADASVLEGDRGNLSMTFTVLLSAPSLQTVTVNFATANGSATTGNKDYVARSGTLTFNPGQTSQTFTVTIRGDRRAESDETFEVNLSGATNATILDAQATGTILNDD